jgi:hypothetical protein
MRTDAGVAISRCVHSCCRRIQKQPTEAHQQWQWHQESPTYPRLQVDERRTAGAENRNCEPFQPRPRRPPSFSNHDFFFEAADRIPWPRVQWAVTPSRAFFAIRSIGTVVDRLTMTAPDTSTPALTALKLTTNILLPRGVLSRAEEAFFCSLAAMRSSILRAAQPHNESFRSLARRIPHALRLRASTAFQ